MNGDFILKNSFIAAKEINSSNAHITLSHTILYANQKLSMSSILGIEATGNKVIAPKDGLSISQINDLTTSDGLTFKTPMPASCSPTLVAFSNPTCKGLCNGSATISIAGCLNMPVNVSWINTNTSGDAFCALTPTATSGFNSFTYTVNTLCRCPDQYIALFEDALGNADPVFISITDPPQTLLSFTSTQPTCNGLCNGQIRANLISGQTPLKINWNPPNVTHNNVISKDTLKNACAGNYSITATNALGCIDNFTYTLTQPIVLLANGSSSSVTCNASCNGSATLSPTGGTAPYTYTWTSGVPANSNMVNGLCAGVVTATVVDTKSCVATYSVNILQPPASTITVVKANLNCANICNGSATLTATGGVAPFSYTLMPGGITTTSIITSLCAGSYSVIVSDFQNCFKTVTFTITSPPTLTATPTQTNITCNGLCDGVIVLNPSGGTGVYSYNWSPNLTNSPNQFSLCTGPYTYSITDALSCLYTGTVTLTSPSASTLITSHTNASCFGLCNGSATLAMTGGTPPYSYTWSPIPPLGQGTATISNLCAGTYSAFIKDFNGCTNSTVITITQPSSVTPNISTVQPTCNGFCDGIINASPTGGLGAYSYTLNSSSLNITTAPPYTGLCAGNYTLYISNNGCIRTNTINLQQPNSILMSLSSTAINCFGQCNSNITANISGGSPTYTVNWSTGNTGLTITNQCVGSYSAIVTDANTCTTSAVVTVTAPTSLTVSINSTNPLCFGNCNGVATASVSGGTPNYTYLWAPSSSTNNINSGLCAGIHTLTVTDNLLCKQTATVGLIAPTQLTLSISNGTTTCNGVCNGTVGVIATGGSPNYSYNWSSIPAQTTSIANGLCQGNYFITVSDQNNCSVSGSANVTQPVALTLSVTGNQSSCNVCIGAATVAANGGTPIYTYTWTNSSNIVVSNANTASNLCSGFYTVITTDAMGCAASTTLEIKQTVIVVVTTNGNTLNCFGSCTGVASANPTGGLPPYNYTWAPTLPLQTTPTATALCAGSYTVNVADALGCSNTGTVTFSNPPATTVTVNKTDESCSGTCDGSAVANGTGGAGSFTYLWLPGGQTTASVNGLCGGMYTVNVTDGNSCMTSTTVQINAATNISAVITSTNPSTCSGTDGSLFATISGGTPGYTFTWTPGNINSNPLTNIGAGLYTLVIKDLLNCTQTVVATLSNPAGPTVTVNSSSLTCFGLCNASATTTAIGATPLTFNWTGGSAPTSSVNTGLCAGNIAITVTDGNNCSTSTVITIAQPTNLNATGIVSNISCNGLCTGSVNLNPTGGTIPYSYTWAPAGGNVQDPTNLCIGNYSVLLSDGNGCSVTNTFAITQPSLLVANVSKKDVLCNGACNGTASVTASGGTGVYSYSWTAFGSFSGSTLNNLVNLCPGIYTVTVTDGMGCFVTNTLSITEPTALTTTVNSTNATCNSLCNGAATITASGGSIPYTYNWNTTPTTTTSIVSTLCVGNYIGTVVDANGCSSNQPITITEPTAITTTISGVNPKCSTSCDGSFTSNSVGGTGAYTYSWIPVAAPSNTLQNPTGLCAGNYTLIVSDANNCKHQSIATLTNPSILLANTTFTNPLCSGVCDGVATANPIGGTAPYTYNWTAPTQTTQTISNLCAGVYTVIVTDANLCLVSQVVTLVNPTVISLNPAVTPASCGSSNGSIDASAVTGNGPFSYNWSAPIVSTNSVVTGLGAGVYTVVITSTNSCSGTFVIPLGNSNGPSGATITASNVSCNGQCDGSAVVSNPIGGTPSYSLTWVIPANPTATITGLCVGGYTAQITDAAGCILFQGIGITEPQLITDNETITSSQCFGNCNGSIALSPTGGNGGYTYNWTNGATTATATNLCPGVISCTITDALGCNFIGTYTVSSLTAITSNTIATNNICFGDCNGSISLANVSGGLAPYSYSWSDGLGQSTAIATNLCNGTYSVIITDAMGCQGFNAGDIISANQIIASSTITDPNCGACNGSATLTPTGGNGIYTYVWSNTSISNPVTSLCAGVYGVQITDGLGCVTNTNIIINSSSGITSEIVTKQDESCALSCNGTATVTAVGGTAPITYNWVHNNSSSPIQNGLCAGTYYCNMTDANGCSRTASVVISSAAVLTINAQLFQTACGASTGSIITTVTGGGGSYTYVWAPASLGTTNIASGLAAGIYTLTVTDANSCSKQAIYIVNSTNAPTVSSTLANSNCASVCNGSVGITISGGTPNYTIAWYDGSNGPSISNLCAGTYSLKVTDNAGCIAIQNYTIQGATPIVFSSPVIHQPKCFNDCNGDLTVLPTGGSLPYTFSWSPTTSTAPTASALCAGSQTVTITDNNGCITSQSYSLTNPASFSLTLSVTNPTCNTLPDGSIDLTVIGGTPSYTYNWAGATSATTEDLTNLLPGSYSITVTDSQGCTKDSALTINSTIVVIAIAGSDATFCQSSNLLLDGGNSVGAITYDWLQLPGNTPIANTYTTIVNPAIGTTTYVLIVANGNCINSDTINITSNPLPLVDAGPFISMSINSNTLIGGSPTSPTGVTYTWIPNNGSLDNSNLSNPTVSNTVTTQFTVTVTDINGCMNSDTVTVLIYPQIKIPSGFSPNLDGKNDVWQLDNLSLFPNNVVEIYNRWGERLFISTGYNVPFDGKYNGKDLPVGTYYYIINLNHPSFPDAYTGPLTIFR